tara:strand:+ start:408 stop:668 length:261 start_codon:yes stop_codon:yes gene_type:complete
MNKFLNFFFLIFVIIFFLTIYRYYVSDKNVKNINLNRSNSDKLIETKMTNIPILKNDTDSIIEFNSSFNEEIKDRKTRSFWNLLKP